MDQHHATMMDPPIEVLLTRVDSKFTLVTVAAQRARQLTSYFNQLSDGLGTIVPPQVHSLSHKPLSIALEEVETARIVPVYRRLDADADEADPSASPDGPEVPPASA